MSTVAVNCPSRTGLPRRFVLLKRDTLYRAFFLLAVLFCAAFWTLQPCRAQSSPPQSTTPPDTQDDPPPSLVKHPKPPPPPPAQSGSAPAPQSGSTAAPPAQTPAPQTDAGQNAEPPATSPAPQNAAPAQSAAPAASSTAASPAAASASPTGAAQSPDGTQSSAASQSAGQAPAAQSASPSSATPASTVPVSTSSASPNAASAPEINTRTSPMPLESRANLVPVRVVVHDSSGHAVENLHKGDFQIKQDGQAQFITHFSVETPGSAGNQVARGEAIPVPTDAATQAPADAAANAGGKPAAAGSITMPTRFVALLFDDSHLETGDLQRTKIAALRFIETSVKPNERLAIYTISGQHQVDFTDDHDAIRTAINALMYTPMGAFDPNTQQDCLRITYYQANLIQNLNDSQAAAAAQADALACVQNLPAQAQAAAAAMLVASTVPVTYQMGLTNTQYAVRRLQEVVRRVSALPGQRSIVLVSPGFLTPIFEYDVSQIIDKANHANIFINTLDARGLYTIDPLGDITQPTTQHYNAATAGLSVQYRVDEQRAQSDVLSDLAYSTGGFYFSNNNDLNAGFRTTAAEPEVSYLLAFVPSNLKNDGKFHTLSVKVLTKEKYTVQARRGFFAPKRGETPEQLAKQDIEDALFSQEEQQNIPIQMHLQYYKSDPGNAKLSVLTHVDLTKVDFEKSQGRNYDDLTIVAALFDRNGNFLTGTEKTLELRLKDSTLERLNQTGVTLNTSFDVKPGGYLVRLVVRDTKAAQLSARNGVVEIP